MRLGQVLEMKLDNISSNQTLSIHKERFLWIYFLLVSLYLPTQSVNRVHNDAALVQSDLRGKKVYVDYI